VGYLVDLIQWYTANWNPRVSLILGKNEYNITVSQILQFTMAGSLNLRLGALGLGIAARSDDDRTCSKGLVDPNEGN
jgi:hypothetical protein